MTQFVRRPGVILLSMNLQSIAAVSFLLLNLNLSAQQEDMKQWLMAGSQEETTSRLIGLGVDKKAAQELAQPSYKLAEWNALRTARGEQFATLFLLCNSADLAYLYLLTKNDSAWHMKDKLELDCHYDENVSVQVAFLRDTQIDEVMVHHACFSHGAFLQQNFSVLSIADGKFKTELETQEEFNVFRVEASRREILEQSTFTVIPTLRPGMRAKEQTRSITVDGKLTVQKRTFRWNAASGQYLPSKFASVASNVKE